MRKLFFLTILLIGTLLSGFSQLQVGESASETNIGRHIQILVDSSGRMGIESVRLHGKFEQLNVDVPNLNITNFSYWVKIPIVNHSDFDELFIDLRQPSIDEVSFYYPFNDGYDSIISGDYIEIAKRNFQHQNYVFPIFINRGEEKVYYIKVKAQDQMLLPISVGSIFFINDAHNFKDIFYGLFAGIMIALLLYNFFIFLKIREKVYAYYIVYLAVIFVAQSNLQGYTLRFFWPYAPWVERSSVYLLIAFSGISGLLFISYYIQAREKAKRAWNVMKFSILVYLIAIAAAFAGFNTLSYKIIEINGLFNSLLIIGTAYRLWRQGSKQAGNMLLAWSIFFTGVITFVLKDFGILPYNDFTFNTMTIGAACEAILLSLGLADKINQLKLEKEEADASRIRTMETQNEVLEVKVHERTVELEDAKDHIQAQFDHLRLTQKQLVESEKLAGLGQMTAGIAHELNNPINFVSSNVGPLHRDIEDVVTLLNEYNQLPEDVTPDQIRELKLKYQKTDIDFVQKEIHQLLNGIEEGSRRTAEIVRGLRIFARADKDTLVSANINECLQSTIVVMKSATKGEVTLTRELDNTMPFMECFPGKLNQVIANLVSNAVQATKLSGRSASERQVHIRSYHDENFAHISVKDNGCGMSDELKEKIFMPFFTTKAVGDGTGLGLSIALGIVEEHHGEIEVISNEGIGSEFIIHLPRAHKDISLSAA